jgi:site-specific DNA recombinase
MKRTKRQASSKGVSFSKQFLMWVPYWFCLAFLLAPPLITYEAGQGDHVYGYLRSASMMVIRCSKRKEDKDDEVHPRDLPPGTRVWIYLRHSPGDNQDLASQEAAVTKLAREKGWIICRIFRDEGVSGSSTKCRRAFETMISHARQKPREADMIIFWEFSRFARNQLDSQFYKAELRRNGWKLLSMNDDIPSGPISSIIEALIDWKNEQYLIDIRVNTKRGLRFIADQGCLPVGQLAKGYSFEEVQISETSKKQDGKPRMGRKPVIDPQVETLIKTAFEMKATGAPNAVIAKKTNLFPAKAGTWNTFFRNRVYIGEYEFDGEIFRNIYPPLISRELFEAVQKHLPVRAESLKQRHHPRRKSHDYYLANIAVCGYCGGPMEGKGSRGHRYYLCARHAKKSSDCPNARYVSAETVETETLHLMLEHVLSKEYLQSLLDWTNEHLNRDLEELQLRLDSTRREWAEADRLADKMNLNFAEAPTPRMRKLMDKQEMLVTELKLRLDDLEYELAHSRVETTVEEIEQYLKQARTLMERGTYFDKSTVCEQLCSRIVMTADECTLQLHFPVWQENLW